MYLEEDERLIPAPPSVRAERKGVVFFLARVAASAEKGAKVR
jgi:hypothetical protein